MNTVREFLASRAKPLVTTTEETLVNDAVGIMTADEIHSLIVMKDDQMVGIFTDRDYVHRYRQLIETIRETADFDGLTPDHEELLDVVCEHWHAGTPLTVRQVMSFEHLASTVTIHRRLKKLRLLELIDLETSKSDSRKREIVPTKQALDYFSAKAKAMQTASR
ncbi:MAG: CBS domain-containing protein [Betaproteobacteria bacterium]|nr:CBS domain-containing protein [Betaproteobacteria bacterium]